MVNNVSTGTLLGNLLVFSVYTLTFAWIIVTKSISQAKLPASNTFALNAHHGRALLGTWTPVLAPYTVLIHMFFCFQLWPLALLGCWEEDLLTGALLETQSQEAVMQLSLLPALQIHHCQKKKNPHLSQNSNINYPLHSLLEVFPIILDKVQSNHKTLNITSRALKLLIGNLTESF